MTNRSLSCREVADAVVRDSKDERAKANIDVHVAHCPSCAALTRLRATVRARVLAENDRLDDLTRARVLARLGQDIHEANIHSATAKQVIRGRFASWTWAWLCGGIAVAAAAIVLAVRFPWPRALPVVSPQTSAPAPSTSRVLTPYAFGSADRQSEHELGKPIDRLELPNRAFMRARLASKAELSLWGPLELAVTEAQAGLVELHLIRGTLVGDYDGTRGGKLRIRSADAVVEVVGTLFSVEAGTSGTRVAVAHGSVRVESDGEIILLSNGQAWDTRTKRVAPTSTDAARLFEQAARNPGESGERTKDATSKPESVSDKAVRRLASRGGPDAKSADRAGRSTSRGFRTAHLRGAAPVRAQVAPAEPAPAAASMDVQARPSPAEDMPTKTAPIEMSPEMSPRSFRAEEIAAPSPSVSAPTPQPAAVSAPRPAPVAATPSSMYRQAERALQKGDDKAGRRLLAELLARFPDEAMADAARFELSMLLHKAGRRDQALRLADELIDGHGPGAGPFVEPARFLRCRLVDNGAAAGCLERFIADFPSSPHTAYALQTLVETAVQSGDCAKATVLAANYLRRFAHGEFARRAEQIRSTCAK